MCVYFGKKLSSFLRKGCVHYFSLPPAKCVSSSCSHPHQQLLLSDFLILTFVTAVLAASHWGFHLHFPDGEPGWVSLHGYISRQCMLPEEEFFFPTGLVSNCWVLQALCMFPKQVLLFDTWFAKTFPSWQLAFSSSEQGVLVKSCVFFSLDHVLEISCITGCKYWPQFLPSKNCLLVYFDLWPFKSFYMGHNV